MTESFTGSIRPMQASDLEDILSIEKDAFRTPWSLQSFQKDLERNDGISLVLVGNGQIIGYIVGWHVLDEIHIGNLAIHPAYRRRGLARKLIATLMRARKPVICTWLEVRKSNTAARSLYKSLGFEEISVRRNYYAEEGEDAIVMVNRQCAAQHMAMAE